MDNTINSPFQKIKYLSHFIARAFLIAVFCMMILISLIVFIYLGDLLFNVQTGHTNNPLFSTYVIVSESMVPTIEINDAIVVKREKDESYHIGDIITFNSSIKNYEGQAITHRIVDKETYTDQSSIYTTKGDNNSRVDPSPVKTESIYGKVLFKIPNAGTIQNYFSKPSNFFLALIIPAMLVILYDIVRIMIAMKKRKET